MSPNQIECTYKWLRGVRQGKKNWDCPLYHWYKGQSQFFSPVCPPSPAENILCTVLLPINVLLVLPALFMPYRPWTMVSKRRNHSKAVFLSKQIQSWHLYLNLIICFEYHKNLISLSNLVCLSNLIRIISYFALLLPNCIYCIEILCLWTDVGFYNYQIGLFEE